MDGIGRGSIDEPEATTAVERAPRTGGARMDDCPGGRGRALPAPTFVCAALPDCARTPARRRRSTILVRRSFRSAILR
jgi:hypothetical protein